MIPDRFTFNGYTFFAGWHDPANRWNGFAVPFFTLDTVRAIAGVVNPWHDSGDSPERIDIDDIGRVWCVSTYCDGDGESRDEVEPVCVDGIDVFPVGGWAWTWEESGDACPVCHELPDPAIDSCTCWFCPACKATNPASAGLCRYCENGKVGA